MKSFAEIRSIVTQCRCEPFVFEFGCLQCSVGTDCHDIEHTWYVAALLWREDTYTGQKGWGRGSVNVISPDSTNGQIVKRCFVAARDYAEHEVREAFEWCGRRVLGPHIDIVSLWEIANKEEH